MLVDQSGSMGRRTEAHSRISGAVTATMLLESRRRTGGDSAGHLGLYLWTNARHPSPLEHRRLGGGAPPHRGDGWLRRSAPNWPRSFTRRWRRSRPARARSSGCWWCCMMASWTRRMPRWCGLRWRRWPRQRILLQPIFIGDDPQAVEANRAVFGRVLACPQVADLPPLLARLAACDARAEHLAGRHWRAGVTSPCSLFCSLDAATRRDPRPCPLARGHALARRCGWAPLARPLALGISLPRVAQSGCPTATLVGLIRCHPLATERYHPCYLLGLSLSEGPRTNT